MSDQAVPAAEQVTASGERAVGAQSISGLVITGDNARAPVFGAAGIPRPADVRAAPGMNNLPRPPTAVFVGRDQVLARLREGLSDPAGAVVVQAVYGLGGVGKSELALQHAHSHRDRYQLRWWITAEDSIRIEAGLADLAGRLCPEAALTLTTSEAAAWAVTWLQAHTGWLLILDNVNDPEDVRPLLGQLAGHVVVTTRRDIGWQRIAVRVRLDVLDPDPAADLITTVTEADDQDAATAIAAELGFLPLALDQATAYIDQARIPLTRYLAILRQHPARMHATNTEGGTAQRTIARLWDITLHAITQRDSDAVRLLHILANYAPDNIPRSIIGGQSPDTGIDEALGLLASYSMITLTPDTVSMHRLLQAVLLASPAVADPTPGGPRPRDTALDWLYQAVPDYPDTNLAAWWAGRALTPHIETIANRYASGEEPAALGFVLNAIALFHGARGDYLRAYALQITACDIALRIYDLDHPQTATCLDNLAVTLNHLGRPADALPLQERALAITEAAFGANHPSTATRLGNLANTFSDLGRYTGALPLRERALTIAESALGPDHPDTAVLLGNLACTLSDMGRYADALPLEERALAMTEATLGLSHPNTATRLGNLARTLSNMGRHTDALPLEERALAITETTLGPHHPDTATRLNNLAATLGDLGRHADALPLQERALAITETSLGPHHPDTALRLGNLAVTYSALGRHADALPLEERALDITEAARGPNHPNTALLQNNLAITLSNLGRHADAEILRQRNQHHHDQA